MPRGKASIAVVCAKATIGDIDDISEFTGTLAGKAEVQVSPKVSGRIKTVFINLGDEVREGQSLALLDDMETQHAVEEAKAKLVVARASLEETETNLETAQRELERVKTLRQRKVAAVSELESAEATVATLLARKKVSEASIQQQEASLRAAEARLSYTNITAPISGYVGKRFVDEGAMVSPTTPIVQLADIRTVKTVINVVERDYSKISVDLKALLTVDAYPGRTFEGRVARIAPILDSNTRTAETEIEIANDDLILKPGMFTRVRIYFGTHENTVLIPNRAVVKRDMRQGVFIPVKDRTAARFIEVTLGLSTDEFTEVDSIEADQEIIVMGQHLLNDGDDIVLNSAIQK
jgi:RND family efflux transporter MFP subunit